MQTLTVADVGERQLISRIRARLAMPSWVIVGPGDDAAVIEPERGALEVLTTDAQIDGIHFDRRFVPPDAVGHRALAVNLSDLAAMGARPRAVLLSLALPEALEVSQLDMMVDGMLKLAAEHRVSVIGGNITRSPGPLMIDLTAVGSVGRRRILTRSGARPGDDVYLSGTVGDARAGLLSLRRQIEVGVDASAHEQSGDGTSAPGNCKKRYLRPEPRVRAGLLLGRNRAASSCMDLSDGLADSVRQIAEASGVGMTIERAAIPLAEDTRQWLETQGMDAVGAALTGGDDYELLFTSSPAQRGRLRAVRQQVGDLPITRIGVVTRDKQVLLRDEHGTHELPQGYEHFR